MVRLAGARAINVEVQQEAPEILSAGTSETLEAQEARLVSTYEHALQHAAAGDADRAKQALRSLLDDPLVVSVGTSQDAGSAGTGTASPGIVQLRALALRNLAGLLLPAGLPTSPAPEYPLLQPDTSPMPGTQAIQAQQLQDVQLLEALALYGEAVKQGGEAEDGVLWSKLAETAGRAGQLGLARYALEAGMAAAPQYQPLLERVMEVAWELGDLPSARDACLRLLRVDPWHPDARAVLAALPPAVLQPEEEQALMRPLARMGWPFGPAPHGNTTLSQLHRSVVRNIFSTHDGQPQADSEESVDAPPWPATKRMCLRAAPVRVSSIQSSTCGEVVINLEGCKGITDVLAPLLKLLLGQGPDYKRPPAPVPTHAAAGAPAPAPAPAQPQVQSALEAAGQAQEVVDAQGQTSAAAAADQQAPAQAVVPVPAPAPDKPLPGPEELLGRLVRVHVHIAGTQHPSNAAAAPAGEAPGRVSGAEQQSPTRAAVLPAQVGVPAVSPQPATPAPVALTQATTCAGVGGANAEKQAVGHASDKENDDEQAHGVQPQGQAQRAGRSRAQHLTQQPTQAQRVSKPAAAGGRAQRNRTAMQATKENKDATEEGSGRAVNAKAWPSHALYSELRSCLQLPQDSTEHDPAPPQGQAGSQQPARALMQGLLSPVLGGTQASSLISPSTRRKPGQPQRATHVTSNGKQTVDATLVADAEGLRLAQQHAHFPGLSWSIASTSHTDDCDAAVPSLGSSLHEMCAHLVGALLPHVRLLPRAARLQLLDMSLVCRQHEVGRPQGKLLSQPVQLISLMELCVNEALGAGRQESSGYEPGGAKARAAKAKHLLQQAMTPEAMAARALRLQQAAALGYELAGSLLLSGAWSATQTQLLTTLQVPAALEEAGGSQQTMDVDGAPEIVPASPSQHGPATATEADTSQVLGRLLWAHAHIAELQSRVPEAVAMFKQCRLLLDSKLHISWSVEGVQPGQEDGMSWWLDEPSIEGVETRLESLAVYEQVDKAVHGLAQPGEPLQQHVVNLVQLVFNGPAQPLAAQDEPAPLAGATASLGSLQRKAADLLRKAAAKLGDPVLGAACSVRSLCAEIASSCSAAGVPQPGGPLGQVRGATWARLSAPCTAIRALSEELPRLAAQRATGTGAPTAAPTRDTAAAAQVAEPARAAQANWWHLLEDQVRHLQDALLEYAYRVQAVGPDPPAPAAADAAQKVSATAVSGGAAGAPAAKPAAHKHTPASAVALLQEVVQLLWSAHCLSKPGPGHEKTSLQLMSMLLQLLGSRGSNAADVPIFLRTCYTWLVRTAEQLELQMGGVAAVHAALVRPAPSEREDADSGGSCSPSQSAPQAMDVDVQQGAASAADSTSAAAVALARSVHGALAQVLQLLVGVKLDWRDEVFGVGACPAGSRLEAAKEEIASAEQVLEVWGLLEPLAPLLLLEVQQEDVSPSKALRMLCERLLKHAAPVPQLDLEASAAYKYINASPDAARDIALVMGRVQPEPLVFEPAAGPPHLPQEVPVLPPAAAAPAAQEHDKQSDLEMAEVGHAPAAQPELDPAAAPVAAAVPLVAHAEPPAPAGPRDTQGEAAAPEHAAEQHVSPQPTAPQPAAALPLPQPQMDPRLLSLYKNLFCFAASIMDVSEFVDTSLLTELGERSVEKAANMLLCDLVHNPRRLVTWGRLAELYINYAQDILDTGAADLTPCQWHARDVELHGRFRRFQARALRALAMSMALESDERERAEHLAKAGAVLALGASRSTPLHDDLPPCSKPGTGSTHASSWLAAAGAAYVAYQRAEQVLQDDWALHTEMGRLMHKMKGWYRAATACAVGVRPYGPEPAADPPAPAAGSVSTQGTDQQQPLQQQAPQTPQPQVQRVLDLGSPVIQERAGVNGVAMQVDGPAAQPQPAPGEQLAEPTEWVSQWLSHHATACRVATSIEGGGALIDPLYRLHAARLRVVLELPQLLTQPAPFQKPESLVTEPQLRLLAQAARHCFTKRASADAPAKAQELLADWQMAVVLAHQVDVLPTSPSHLWMQVHRGACQLALTLVDDCTQAMRWVADTYRTASGSAHYHRAHYQLARAALMRGDAAQALEELSPVVGSGAGRKKDSFSVSVVATSSALFESGAKQRGKKGRGGKSRRGTALSIGAAELVGCSQRRMSCSDLQHAADMEAQSGLEPVQVVGLGEDEAEKDCMAAARRCVKLYLRAAYTLRMVTDGAGDFLRSDKQWSTSMSDLSSIACGMGAQHVLEHLAQHLAKAVTDPASHVATREQLPAMLESVHQLYFTHAVEHTAGTKPLEQLHQSMAVTAQYLGPWQLEELNKMQVCSEGFMKMATCLHIQHLEQHAALDKLQALGKRIQKKFKSAGKVPPGVKDVVEAAMVALTHVTASKVQELCTSASQHAAKAATGPSEDVPASGALPQPVVLDLGGEPAEVAADPIATQAPALPSEPDPARLEALNTLKQAAAVLVAACSLNPSGLCSGANVAPCEQHLNGAWVRLHAEAAKLCHMQTPAASMAPPELGKSVEVLAAQLAAQIAVLQVQPEQTAPAAGTRRTLRHVNANVTQAATALEGPKAGDAVAVAGQDDQGQGWVQGEAAGGNGSAILPSSEPAEASLDV